ncbi:MAG: ATP-dependent Clp protease proteolytic subunit [Tepidisphaeraceae bacterium]
MKTILCALLFAWLGTAVAFAQGTRPSTPTTVPTGPAAIVELNGEINDFSARIFEKHVTDAKAAGAKIILVKINTPGGAVVSALRMSQFIKRQRNDAQIVAVVNEMALSAGAMLSVACDRIVMEPGALLGDCAPILMGPDGLQTLGNAERAKMESPILAEFYDSADRSGYDKLMMSAMVQYGVVVHYLQSPAGEKRFANADEAKSLKASGWTDVAGVPSPLDGADGLLTVNDRTAATIGLSAGTYASPEAYAAALGMPVIGTYVTTAGEKFVGFFSDPALRSLLGIVFLWSLYTAITKPGTGGPEVIALVSGAVLVGVPLLTGYAGWLELSMIILGVLLIALELFIIPGFGIAGISGIILLIVGLVLTYAPPELPGMPILPQLQGTRTAIKHGLISVTTGLVVSAFLWVWLAKYLPKIPYMNRLVLETSVGSTPEPTDARDAIAAAWPTVGTVGQAVTTLAPGGVAQFYDPLINDVRPVDVICDSGYVEAGTQVAVRAREGLAVVVRVTQPQSAGKAV